MSALAARTVGLHAAFWQYDRRYRWAWFVWPQAMALLIAGWLFADRAAPIAGDWAKPVDCAVPSNAGCAATQRSVLVFPDDVINPTLISQVTVVVDPSAFKTSSAADQPRLAAALAGYYRREPQKSLDVLKQADGADPNVQFVRALALLGDNTIDSARSAQGLLRTALAAGHRQAGAVLGRTLMGWFGLPKDEKEARRLIEAGAATGDPYSMRVAAVGYLGREFGVYDPVKAADLMRRSADGGDPGAMIQLARFLDTGLGGIGKDQEKAIDYLRRAAEVGFTGAQSLLGDWIMQRYRDREIEDPSEGMRLYERAYQQGYSFQALVNLAFAHRSARAAPWFDTARSFALLQQCAPYAFSHCHYWLAASYHAGAGTALDYVKAYAHYVVAQRLGRTDAATFVQQLDGALLPAAKTAGTELAAKISAGLKPVPAQISLQTPDAIAGPAPWTSKEPPPAKVVAARPADTAQPGQGSQSSQPEQGSQSSQSSQGSQSSQSSVAGKAPTTGAQAEPTRSSASAADWAACKGNDSGLAIAACARLIAGGGLSGSDLGWAYYYKAWTHSNKGERDQAIADYTEAIRLQPSVPESHNNRGAVYLALGKLDQAFGDFDEAIRLNASFALAYANRGEVYRRQNQPERAIADATSAIRLDPKLVRGYLVRAGAYEHKEQWTNVVADCTTAIELDPKSESCLDKRGYAYSRLAKSDLALADYDQSLRLEPRSPWTLTARGNVRRDRQQFDLAFADYSEAIRVQPKYANAYANRSDVQFLKRQYQLAIDDAGRAIELDSKSALAFAVRGRSHLELGHPQEAEFDLTSAVQLSPKSPNFRYFRAIAEAKLEDAQHASCPKPGTRRQDLVGGGGPPICMTGVRYTSALSDLDEAIRLDPDSSDAYAYRGNLFLALHQRDRGIADLRRALQINPNNDYARGVLRAHNVSR